MKGTKQILISGFGGQGALFAGKFLAYAGLLQGLEVSWLPSYGPEMRGGTASCSVIISDSPIGSPIITHPDVLVAMNLPSMDKFEPQVNAGGTIIYDSSLISRAPAREDVNNCAVPATKMATDAGVKTLANMLLIGRLLREVELADDEMVDQVLSKVVSAKHADLLDLNKQAIKLGYEYKE